MADNGQDPYITERRIIAEARIRVDRAGTDGADPSDRQLVVMGYVADMIRTTCPVTRGKPCLFPESALGGTHPKSLTQQVMERGGPWALPLLIVAYLVDARLTGGVLARLLTGG